MTALLLQHLDRKRLLEDGGTQEAPDMIGAKRRLGAWHMVVPGKLSSPAQAGDPVIAAR